MSPAEPNHPDDFPEQRPAKGPRRFLRRILFAVVLVVFGAPLLMTALLDANAPAGSDISITAPSPTASPAASVPVTTDLPPSQLVSPASLSAAARAYAATAAKMNAASTLWATNLQSIGTAAASASGSNEQIAKAFLTKFLPECHTLAQASRTFKRELDAIDLPADQRAIADVIAEKADWVTTYLERWDDPDTFIKDMGPSLDSWLVYWYDVTGDAQVKANELRAALGLPESDVWV